MTGIVIVIISVVAAAYLIVKKYYAPGALLFVGLITLAVVALISPDPILTGKKATHLEGLDVIQIMTNLLQSRAAGLGMNIMIIGGFASYMDRIGAAGALVSYWCRRRSCSLKRQTFVLYAFALPYHGAWHDD